jgi:hypothetical protein
VAWGTERTCRWIARNGEGSNSGEGHADAAWLAHDQSSTQRGRWSTGCANASAGRHFLGEDNDASEFGWKAVTDSPLTGVTRNPWDARLTSGGSSGGAGVAAALGMGTLHLGTDGGGSIRVPASFCGVIGFKPTWRGLCTSTLSCSHVMASGSADPNGIRRCADGGAGHPRLVCRTGVEHGLYRNGLGDGVEGARIDLLVNCAESPASPGRRWAK